MFGWLKPKEPVAVPERVQRLIVEINEGEFGGIDVNHDNHYDASTCWIHLPDNRAISARWYPNGNRSELSMRRGSSDYVSLPNDQWGRLILDTIIAKAKRHHEDQLSELLK